MRPTVLFAGVALMLLACSAEETLTEPAAGPGPNFSSAQPGSCGPDFEEFACLRFPNGDSVNVSGGYEPVYIADVSPSGDVVGSYGQGGYIQAFLWSNGVFYQLETGNRSEATAINPRGQVVGFGDATDGSGATHALLWELVGSDIVTHDLGSLGGTLSWATDISPSGVVTGVSTTAAGEYHLFEWRRGVMTDLGPA